MFVNKIKIRVDYNNDKFIKIPLSLSFNGIDQSEVVNTDFINLEVEKAINPIVDYEEVRLTPLNSNNQVINDLIVRLHFLDVSGSMIVDTNFSQIGFTNDDVKYRKSRLLNSFVRLNFYDSPSLTNQNLVSSVTIYPKLSYGGGISLNASEVPVKFTVSNPITKPLGFAEGYYLYHFKTEVNKDAVEPKKLYMRAEFNNASTGKTTKFITVNDKLLITDLIPKLHVEYLLTRTNTGYYYKLNTAYNGATNIIENGLGVTLNLYEIQVI